MGHRCKLSAIIAFVLLLGIQPLMASRILGGEEEWMKRSVLLGSLQRGSVPSSGSSTCTYVPGSGGNSCPIPATVSEKNFAGSALAHISAFPHLLIPFGVASDQK
uniref:Uncharacterized protein n=1 Tax=Nelumbo nucifera TaxID=4432 RepID=A0A822YW16_NELNU|nr:TPA_asm: hypothetical protein HUJ06_007351 [Nelumbo nucifera]